MFETEELIDSYEKDMQPYFESDTYKYQRAANNNKIEALRSTLTQQQLYQLNDLLNGLSNEYADIALTAYNCNHK